MESVQYFQFDKEGNMYVFEPGSGFSGCCLRVEPGFKLNECSENSFFSDGVSGESSSVTKSPSEICQEAVECGSQIVSPTPLKRFVFCVIYLKYMLVMFLC